MTVHVDIITICVKYDVFPCYVRCLFKLYMETSNPVSLIASVTSIER